MSEVTHGCEPHRKAARFRLSPNFRVMELRDFVNHIVATVFVHVQHVCEDGKLALYVGGRILIDFSSAKYNAQSQFRTMALTACGHSISEKSQPDRFPQRQLYTQCKRRKFIDEYVFLVL